MSENYLVGACGKRLETLCFPSFEDDLCASCSLNGYYEEQASWPELDEMDEEVAH